MKKEESGHKPYETLTCVTLIFGEKGPLDVPRFTCRSIRLGVVAIEESAKSILTSLFLSCKEDEANITSTLTDDIKHTWSTVSKSALGPLFPGNPFFCH